MKDIKPLDPLKVAPEHRNQIELAQIVRLQVGATDKFDRSKYIIMK